jgi:Leucine-rich repeat (LRR) protein
MEKVFGLGLIFALCLHLPTAATPTQQISVKSFANWCQERNSVTVATRHTIDVLLKEADTENCQRADRKLSSFVSLSLIDQRISDLKPLASLNNLAFLTLSDNKIVDLTPLAGLSNLTSLQLDQNQIIDIKPLAGLSNLTSLYLDRNQIVDIKPLAQLRNLTQLYLNRNQIAVKTCPLKPESICRF